MDVKIRTNISQEFENIEVCINAPERNEAVQKLENKLLVMQEGKIKNLIGSENNDIFIINISEVILFFSEEKNNFCKTQDGTYKIKEKLYELEEALPQRDFIRISHSTIINVNHVKCFNTSIIGKIIVKFKDGTQEIVAKRRTAEIMKFLKNRRGIS